MGDRDLAVVILAAGQGTRMRSTLPKLLHRVGGVPLINHVLDTASTLPSSVVIAVVRHERERVSEAIHSAMPAAVIVDQDDIAGTGRAAQVAVDALPVGFDGDVLILNGDVPLLDSATVSAFVRGHQDSDAALSLLSAILPDATGYGRIVRDTNGTVQRIVEERDASSDERAITEVNGGVYLVGAAALRDHLSQLNTNNAQGERYLTDVIQSLREAGAQIDAIPVERPWELEGVNDRAQLSEAEARMNALIIRGWQLAGVTIKDPASTWIDITATIAPDVEILPGCHIAGATDIASGAVIGPDTTLLDCEVGEGATVKRTDATLAVIGAGASVGPYSYLRPGTQLGAGGKIGTFVETKNAVIGDGSKVPHLSYIGDAEVGEQSNIGAGTIVANYDGVNKHRTTVGSHVRTGSHNVFVAPVTIGDGAYSGAGTVVRKDVPSGSLAISVAPQRNVAGWVQKNRPGSEAAAAAAEADGNSAADR